MSSRISRRRLTIIDASLVAIPVSGSAQPTGRVYTVGVLSVGAPATSPERDFWIQFINGMRELGYVEGRNLVVKRGAAAGSAERLGELTRDLVARTSTSSSRRPSGKRAPRGTPPPRFPS